MINAARSIFRDSRPRGQGGPSRSTAPTIAIRQPSTVRPDTVDARLIAVLDAPLASGESAHAGFRRKEEELGAIFATLSVLESRALHSRLSLCKAGDELANKFARLMIDRRARLLMFLADARRREALNVHRATLGDSHR